MYRLWLLALVLACSGCVKERIVYRDNPASDPTSGTPIPEATPAPPSLRFPQGIPDAEILVVPGVPTLHDVINQETAAMFPGCQIYTKCDGLGYDPQSFFAVLAQRLRARGLWAGQHRDGQSDEIVVAQDCRGEWESYHQWVYIGYPGWARASETPCAGHGCTGKGTSYRGNTIIPASYCK